MTQFIHQPHDKLFKQSLADIRVAHDFFETHLPVDLLQKIDLSTFKLQKQSFVDEAYKMTEADVFYQVKIGDALAYLYILCEHQQRSKKLINVKRKNYISLLIIIIFIKMILIKNIVHE